LLLACKLVETGGEAKRMCAQSAVSIDGEKATDPNAQIMPAGGMTIQVGKRKFARLKVDT
jgi:tyrosyl-tRNA synthetase